MKYLILLFLALTATSCSSYINKLHRQLDQDIQQDRTAQTQRYAPRRRNDNFDLYRNKNRQFVTNEKRMVKSSRNFKYVAPKTKRQYRPIEKAKKRYTADDLNDNGNQASLWAQNSNQLFYRDAQKRNGDIILINVFGNLKNDITIELKRAFPDPIKKKKKGDTKGNEKKEETPATAAAQPQGNKVHDRISSVIIEEINQDHLLLRGRKHLLYKNAKRLVEIQALVARKDITDDDTINSDRILENTVTVLR